MDSTTYTDLTGNTVTESQTTRFEAQKKVARKKLERMLGYPLCPSDWGNQYLEIGKTDGCFCSISNDTELEPPDDVVNAYRFFRWNPRDTYLAIDPATQIHAVKVVQGDVTVRTFQDDEYRPQWHNARKQTPYTTYLAIDRDCWLTWHSCYWRQPQSLLVAVDADWAYKDVPLELQQAWADIIAFGLDDKRLIRSESAGTHSYSKFDQGDPMTVHADTIAEYAGPNGQGGAVPVL